MNPIFRWTIGGCTRNGYDCLEMSIRTATKIYGDRFDYFVLYNNCNVQQLREIVGHRPITLVEQDWEHNPLGLEKGKNRGTSLWKFCPTRLDPSRHEIICDNDLVIVNRFPQMEEFLRSSDKVLMVEDPIKFQGKFRHLFGSVNYNAGFIGLPPGYDFAAEMLRTWRDNGSPSEVNQPDEQGLTTATLARMPSIVVGKDRFTLVHSEGGTASAKYNPDINRSAISFYDVLFFGDGSDAYHFVGANKSNRHVHWDIFKKFVKRVIL